MHMTKFYPLRSFLANSFHAINTRTRKVSFFFTVTRYLLILKHQSFSIVLEYKLVFIPENEGSISSVGLSIISIIGKFLEESSLIVLTKVF